jgi:hypothetical protein
MQTNIQFAIHNKQEVVHIDEPFWNRAFNFAIQDLQIEYHYAMIDCVVIRLNMERKVK